MLFSSGTSVMSKHPKLFANHVIKQMVGHVLGEDVVIELDDYTSMRVVFRQSEGSWLALADGDLTQMDLLRSIVKSWGQMPGRFKKTDGLI